MHRSCTASSAPVQSDFGAVRVGAVKICTNTTALDFYLVTLSPSFSSCCEVNPCASCYCIDQTQTTFPLWFSLRFTAAAWNPTAFSVLSLSSVGMFSCTLVLHTLMTFPLLFSSCWLLLNKCMYKYWLCDEDLVHQQLIQILSARWLWSNALSMVATSKLRTKLLKLSRSCLNFMWSSINKLKLHVRRRGTRLNWPVLL